MKYVTFPAAGKLAALASMLECCGHDTSDSSIALGMHAPWLFLKKDGRYLAGSALYEPHWLDLYLAPHGFRMTESTLPKDEIPAYLRSCRIAMLTMRLSNERVHPVVYTGYVDHRYTFTNVKVKESAMPDSFSLTATTLKRRLADQATVYSLENCSALQVDFIPLLIQSLHNLAFYQHDILEALQMTVTREEFQVLNEQLLRALMQDALPMAMLIGDAALTHELLLLNHDYRHVFTRNSPKAVALEEKLPRSSIRKCIAWLREDIIDQLYNHGLSDRAVESILCNVQQM